MLFRLTNRIFDIFGYSVEKKGSKRGFNQYNADYLSQICQPQTVIDVGVGYGTPELYKAFPQAYFILVEPLEDYRPAIDEILKNITGEAHYTAVGNSEGEINIIVDPQNLQLTTMYSRPVARFKQGQLENRTVPITSIDTLLARRKELASPVLMKIDTEGNELSVIEGASTALQAIDYVIAEVSITERFEGSYQFEDFCAGMQEMGFYLYSFLSVAQKPDGLRPRFADVLFAKRGI